MIKRVSGIVGHAAVDNYVILVPWNTLDTAYGIDGHPGIRYDAATGFHEKEGHRKTE